MLENGEDVGVVDGDGGQHGKLRKELLLGGREPPAVARLDDAQHADHLPAELQRSVEVGLFAPTVHLGGLGGRKVGIVAVNLDDAPLPHDGHVVQTSLRRVRLADPRPLFGELVGDAPRSHVVEQVGRGRVAVDVGGGDGKGFADLPGDGAQHLVDRQSRGDCRPDPGDDRLRIVHETDPRCPRRPVASYDRCRIMDLSPRISRLQSFDRRR